MRIYLIGSLRNPQIPIIAETLRNAGHDVFDDWHSAGKDADDNLRDYEKARGRTFEEAIKESLAMETIFNFDYQHLRESDAAVLVMPAGKSGFLELGWKIGRGYPGYILLDDPERWDVMFKFATGVYSQLSDLLKILEDEQAYWGEDEDYSY